MPLMEKSTHYCIREYDHIVHMNYGNKWKITFIGHRLTFPVAWSSEFSVTSDLITCDSCNSCLLLRAIQTMTEAVWGVLRLRQSESTTILLLLEISFIIVTKRLGGGALLLDFIHFKHYKEKQIIAMVVLLFCWSCTYKLYYWVLS